MLPEPDAEEVAMEAEEGGKKKRGASKPKAETEKKETVEPVPTKKARGGAKKAATAEAADSGESASSSAAGKSKAGKKGKKEKAMNKTFDAETEEVLPVVQTEEVLLVQPDLTEHIFNKFNLVFSTLTAVWLTIIWMDCEMCL